MNRAEHVRRILASRRELSGPGRVPDVATAREAAAEGGCGVVGLACDEPVAGRHLLAALDQMRNRGNGKGGGIAAVGLDPDQMGVTRDVLDEDYILTVAYLDPACRDDVESSIIETTYHVDHVREVPTTDDAEVIATLDTTPPDVVQYFVRPRAEAVEAFASEHGLDDAPVPDVEDELVYQTSYRLNQDFYSATGEARAFVLSHGKDMLVLKAVAYADDVVRYYALEDVKAHVWIGHHRYPTKGKVWHPGGAHPFIGMHEALVHNGDFANYHSVAEYLAQRNIRPLFLTDTEVSVLVFDLIHRTYGYPLEYVIEALAPTTERDFTQLPDDKRAVYDAIQRTHMHGSPDGPWFFIIAQSLPDPSGAPPTQRLLGITDTSMLRPQVFAIQRAGDDGPAIGLAASEKQGIDAVLSSLAAEDDRFWSRADTYWNARGGSHTDGGAFQFTVTPRDADGNRQLVCTDKFGTVIDVDTARTPLHPADDSDVTTRLAITDGDTARDIANAVIAGLATWTPAEVRAAVAAVPRSARDDATRRRALDALTLLVDERYDTGEHRRSSLLSVVDDAIGELVAAIRDAPSAGFVYTAVDGPDPGTPAGERVVVIDAEGFEPEGDDSVARRIVSLVRGGDERFVVVNCRGHRFIGNGLTGLVAGTDRRVRIDAYGASGDYLGSGMVDGVEVHVHGNAQDQLAQIMNGGRLVVHGDVGQAFMYGAKAGEAYVKGNAAGRPLINAVGSPKVVINGTALDYLGESFMAGDPHRGGGFVIVNGIRFDDAGDVVELDTPYPGSNLFSLASGGALYIRDPRGRVSADQLNGGAFAEMTDEDWELIRARLEDNEALFGITVARLLTVDGERKGAAEVYRKVVPGKVKALQAEEAWVQKKQHG